MNAVVDPPAPPESGGLADFWSTLRDLRRFFAYIAAGATLPFIANLAYLTPPWPSGITTLTSIAMLVALVLIYHGIRIRNDAADVVYRSLRRYAVLLAVVGIVYLSLISLFTYRIPDTEIVHVKGYACTSLIKDDDGCPFLTNNLLRDGEWDPTHFWTPVSIAAMQLIIVASWIGLFYCLTALFASFIVYWRAQPGSKPPDPAIPANDGIAPKAE